MPELAVLPPRLPAMTDFELGEVRRLQYVYGQKEQIPLRTRHFLYAGVYSRTIWAVGTPEVQVLIVGALIKIPTQVSIDGDVLVWVGSKTLRLTGHNVLAGSAGRKQVFLAYSDVRITMSFGTKAKTIEEAEREFTDEVDDLCSRRDPDNEIIITGE